MKAVRGYKTELDLNNAQKTACINHAGASRYAYNWGLQRYQEEYQAGRKTPNALSLHKELNVLKQTELSWMYAVSKCAPQEALRNLEKAFKRFFGKAKLKQQGKYRGKLGYPRFKSKKKGIGLSGSRVPSTYLRIVFNYHALENCACMSMAIFQRPPRFCLQRFQSKLVDGS